MTNGERADRLAHEARQIAGEMLRALDDEAWNLATRRAQEALELMVAPGLPQETRAYRNTHATLRRPSQALLDADRAEP